MPHLVHMPCFSINQTITASLNNERLSRFSRDIKKWCFIANGQFTVKSFYGFLSMDVFSVRQPTWFWKVYARRRSIYLTSLLGTTIYLPRTNWQKEGAIDCQQPHVFSVMQLLSLQIISNSSIWCLCAYGTFLLRFFIFLNPPTVFTRHVGKVETPSL